LTGADAKLPAPCGLPQQAMARAMVRARSCWRQNRFPHRRDYRRYDV